MPIGTFVPPLSPPPIPNQLSLKNANDSESSQLCTKTVLPFFFFIPVTRRSEFARNTSPSEDVAGLTKFYFISNLVSKSH